MTLKLDLKLLPKQGEFLNSTAFETMYSGAVRAGKTYCLVLKTAWRAARPGAREILTRKTLASLKGTTLRTLLDGDGNTPPILPAGSFTHNKADKIIRINGGGEIIYFGLVNDGEGGTQQRIGSYTATGVNIDEATELDEADYRMLASRPSLEIPGLVRQMNMACNPGSPSHFLAARFAPPGSGITTPMRGCRCISTETSDNFFLPPEYIEQLDREVGTLWHRRFVKGLWCGSDGLVYDRWDRSKHAVPCRDWDPRRAILLVDDGYTNPFALMRLEMDGDGRMRVCAEVYETGKQPEEKLEYIMAMAGSGLRPEAVVIDPSANALRDRIAGAGLNAVKADNEVFDGIMTVQKVLAPRGDGQMEFTVDPVCANVIREFETYEWRPGRDEPVKAHDHAMDAIRYGVRYFDATNRHQRAVPSKTISVARTSLELPYQWGDLVHAGDMLEDLALRKRDRGSIEWVDLEEDTGKGGRWRLWCDLVTCPAWKMDRPPQRRTYVIGCCASPVGESTMVVTCAETREQVGEYSAVDMGTEEFARACARAGMWWGGSSGMAYLVWRADQAYGIPFGEYLTKTLVYPFFYRDHPDDRMDTKRGMRLGWQPTAPKMLTMIERFRRSLAGKAGKAIDLWVPKSARLVDQLDRYTLYRNGRMGPAELEEADQAALLTHSDLVVPAMLSSFGVGHVGRAKAELRVAPYGSKAWMEQEAAKKTVGAKERNKWR